MAWSSFKDRARIDWIVRTANANLNRNQGVFANSASQLEFTLPTTAAVGDVIRVSGMNTGGFQIKQNAGQTVYFSGASTTTGATGTVTAVGPQDAIELICRAADNEFQVVSSVGNFTIV